MIGSGLCVTEQSSNREPENLEAGDIHGYISKLRKRGAAWPPFIIVKTSKKGRMAEQWPGWDVDIIKLDDRGGI